MLELDLHNLLFEKDRYVLCLSYFSSGESSIKMKLKNNMENIKITIAFQNCINHCLVYVYIGDRSFLMSKGISNSWIYVCIEFDTLNQEMLLALANKVVFQQNLKTLGMIVPNNLDKLKIWWDNTFFDVTFPDKISLLNIHSNDRPVDKFKCGEPGDLYSWNVEDWKSGVGDKNLTLLTSQESKYQACQADFQVYALPGMNFHDSKKTCESTNGYMYFEDTIFQELIHLEGVRNIKSKFWGAMHPFWIPYTDEEEEGDFKNVYSNRTLTIMKDLFLKGQPNGGHIENCLQWSSVGLWDSDCVNKYFSLCKIPKSEPYLVLRGLCLGSQVERFYTSGNDGGKFIWKGHSFASIQYTDRWLLFNILNNVWAESKAKYESLLIGTNEWTIHNDNCGNELYTSNLSLR